MIALQAASDLPGFRPGYHVKAPFTPWQLSDLTDGPWGVQSVTGVNVLGANLESPGVCFATKSLAEAIAAHWNTIAGTANA